MARGVDYYSLLGVSRSASADEIRRRYRQLVRSHHPDVAADQEAAHERFILLVEAYHTLADPVRRRAYDAVQAVTVPVRTQSAQVREQIDDWFRHAVHRFEQHDLAGAAAQCRKILALDPVHAAAHAMLGDLHAGHGEWDQALVCYSAAVSAAPRNLAYARKLRGAAEEGQKHRAAMERRERAAEHRRRAIEALNARHEFAAYSSLLAGAWLLLLVIWVVRDPGPVVGSWFPLPLHLTLGAAGAGLMAGFVLGINRLPRPTAEHPRRAAIVTLGLGLISALQFYLGVASYVALSFVRERLVPSLTIAFATAFALVVAFAVLLLLAAPERQGAWLAAVAWSGNVIFPAVLLGQGLGRWGLRPLGA